VPAAVLKHANAFMRLFEDSPEFLARAISRSAQLYLDGLPPPDVQGTDDYTLQASYSVHTPGQCAASVPQEPRGHSSTSSRREHAALGRLGLRGRARSLLTTPGRSPPASATQRRFFGADETLFVVRHVDGEQDRVARHLGKGDLVLCDRKLPQVDPALASS